MLPLESTIFWNLSDVSAVRWGLVTHVSVKLVHIQLLTRIYVFKAVKNPFSLLFLLQWHEILIPSNNNMTVSHICKTESRHRHYFWLCIVLLFVILWLISYLTIFNQVITNDQNKVVMIMFFLIYSFVLLKPIVTLLNPKVILYLLTLGFTIITV